ncbi:MAG TPA: GMP synthase [Candidatus Polarisedimenticolia bacterium]|nr:GMP synthase [Candidatus Polarisedimenticolia bacterium]
MIRILILRTGSTAAEVRARDGDYDRWFTDALEGTGASFDVRDLVAGDDPTPGSGHEGVIVTGSTSAAYREETWMPPLVRFLAGAGDTGVPVLCVCFGAQLAAQARGGRVALNPEGWEIGGVRIELTDAGRRDPLMEGLPPVFGALATHEDRIEELPPGGVLLAGNRSSPVQAFRAGRLLWGVQFHPEITPGILATLISLRARTLCGDAAARGLPREGHVERLLASVEGPEVLQARRVLENFSALCRARAASPVP